MNRNIGELVQNRCVDLDIYNFEMFHSKDMRIITMQIKFITLEKFHKKITIHTNWMIYLHRWNNIVLFPTYVEHSFILGGFI